MLEGGFMNLSGYYLALNPGDERVILTVNKSLWGRGVVLCSTPERLVDFMQWMDEPFAIAQIEPGKSAEIVAEALSEGWAVIVDPHDNPSGTTTWSQVPPPGVN
jgi:hypothetical protein